MLGVHLQQPLPQLILIIFQLIPHGKHLNNTDSDHKCVNASVSLNSCSVIHATFVNSDMCPNHHSERTPHRSALSSFSCHTEGIWKITMTRKSWMNQNLHLNISELIRVHFSPAFSNSSHTESIWKPPIPIAKASLHLYQSIPFQSYTRLFFIVPSDSCPYYHGDLKIDDDLMIWFHDLMIWFHDLMIWFHDLIISAKEFLFIHTSEFLNTYVICRNHRSDQRHNDPCHNLAPFTRKASEKHRDTKKMCLIDSDQKCASLSISAHHSSFT